jgi:hypothetical protein
MGMITSEQIRRGLRAISTHENCVAVDLGQSQDWTAIAGMEKITIDHVTYKGVETRIGEQYHLRYLRRLPLGLSYVDQMQEVARLMARPPLDAQTPLILDETGVGRAVADLAEDAGLKPIRVSITAGSQQTARGPRSWLVPKSVLISHLDARLHTGQLKIADSLAEADVLRDELKDFRRHVSAAGHYSYSARNGKHDDLLLSTCLAMWGLIGLPKSPVAQISKAGFIN